MKKNQVAFGNESFESIKINQVDLGNKEDNGHLKVKDAPF